VKIGDLVRIVVKGSWAGVLGTVLSPPTSCGLRRVLTHDGDWYFAEGVLEVIDEGR
jgi:hypothetical protein